MLLLLLPAVLSCFVNEASYEYLNDYVITSVNVKCICVCCTAHWSSPWEPRTADFHRVEWRVVGVWRDWHEATVFLVLARQLIILSPVKPRLVTVVVVTDLSSCIVRIEPYHLICLLSEITTRKSSDTSILRSTCVCVCVTRLYWLIIVCNNEGGFTVRISSFALSSFWLLCDLFIFVYNSC